MASEIGFSGLGSGIDFNVIRDAILSQRTRPITQLQTKVGTYNNRIGALKQLNTALATVTSAAEALTNRDLGTGKSATVADNNILAATSSSQANLGNFEINVTRLATNLNQASRSYSSTDTPILANSATTATFELRKGGAASGTAITIDTNNNTLAGLRDAINAANAGVTANIVDISGDGTQQQIVLSSNETGTSGRVELVETTATGTLTDLNLRSLNPPDSDFSKLDAAFSLNGLNLTRSSNSISDAVSGVTLSLKKVGTTSVNVTQSPDIENKIRSFVTAYNAVQDFMATQYQKTGNGAPSGVLAGDTALRNVQKQLRESVGAISENNGGSLSSLSEIGITVTNDGRLNFDSGVLNDKLKTNADDVRSLLFGKTENDKGIFQQVFNSSGGLSNSVTGSVQNAINGYESSVKSLNSSINVRLEQINLLRESLTRRFAAADAAIGQMNGQNTSLTNIINSLRPKES